MNKQNLYLQHCTLHKTTFFIKLITLDNLIVIRNGPIQSTSIKIKAIVTVTILEIVTASLKLFEEHTEKYLECDKQNVMGNSGDI